MDIEQADIAQEVETLRDYLADPSLYSRIWMQNSPPKQTAGELSIRYVGDEANSETGAVNRYDRLFQFVYYGANELDCIRKASALQRKLNDITKLNLKGSTRYMTVGPFGVSAPFKAEDGAIYNVVGVLQAEVRELRASAFADAPTIGGIGVDIAPTAPDGSDGDGITVPSECEKLGGVK